MKLRYLLLLVPLCSFAQSIIPEPVEMTTRRGRFTLPKVLTFTATDAKRCQPVTTYVKDFLVRPTGIVLRPAAPKEKAALHFILNNETDRLLGDEGYRLAVNSGGIFIRANTEKGLFYGVQTVLQLLPKDIERTDRLRNGRWSVPFVTITDYPRFAYRGLMLDVARHFFTKAEVMDYIDRMARYKFNTFHWHLADDEGWRVEIKSYPKLTTVGAWNVKREGHFGDFSPIGADEPRDNGGFYTQEEIREVVAYAKSRFIDILPEIDMPGHSLAAIASYPELSCTPEAVNYRVSSGEPIMSWPGGGHFEAIYDNMLCPANEKVYAFADAVLGEIAALFPYPYLHVGGDECATNFWAKNPQVQELMQREGITEVAKVQAYFEKRIEQIVASKGKHMIGWDEIYETGVSPSTAIMNWRKPAFGAAAAADGHEVVLCPTGYSYLDYMQADVSVEPRVYAGLRLKKTYAFEPIADGIKEGQVKGIQANLWTEQVFRFRQAQYMTWPRAFAVSETAWSQPKSKNWKRFVDKVEQQFRRLDAANVRYAPSLYDPDFRVTTDEKGRMLLSLVPELDELELYYSFDNSEPDNFYPKYTGPVLVPIDATQVKVRAYRDGKPIGRMNVMLVEVLRKRVKVK
ncbi:MULTISPECIES: beta-N-acetylhexosaminidase [unclassified Flavobacterium]|uniref:beta-N-acetylhexosaminidase n=1 Tax=unclassified Flavobacterium TaxID=196869 RepID=UPI001F148B4E|nr:MULTISPECIES: family 20 glycosylhydrolase [unclassified Flavobacterium]UMY66474.1 family 20 glycosylhydrolase [Flavobacterium sp. HJ-32-4]